MEPAMAPATILIADDSTQVREVLVELIDGEPDMRVVATAADADEAVELAVTCLPDVVVLDVHMPGSGVVAAERFRDVVPRTNLVVLTGDPAALSESDCVRLGLSAYLVKGVPNATIVAAIRRAAGAREIAEA